MEINKQLTLRNFPKGSLHALVYSHDAEGITAILAEGKEDVIFATYNGDKTALHVAAMMGESQVVEQLLDYSDAFLEMRNAQGYTALHAAANEGNVEAMNVLLRKGANISASCTALGTTPLHRAALAGAVDCVRELVKSGADVSAVDRAGEQPLHGAAYYGHTETCEALVELGAKVDAPVKDKQGFTPLLLAIRRQRIATAKALLALGADCNTTSTFLESPLHVAAQYGVIGVVRPLVVEQYADVTLVDDSGSTAIEVANSRGYPEVAAAIEAALTERVSPTPQEENDQVAHQRKGSFKRMLSAGNSFSKLISQPRSPFRSCFGSAASEVVVPVPHVSSEINPADD